MKSLKLKFLFWYAYIFQIIFNVNCQQYVPMGRIQHTATFVGTKIYFLGGNIGKVGNSKSTNDFFYLDISKSFDKAKDGLPLVNLTDNALIIPPHYGAATSVFGKLKDSIFFFGGDTGILNDQSRLTYSFNTTQLEWKVVTVSQGILPIRKSIMDAVTDSNDKIYIFGGGFGTNDNNEYVFSNEINIFDTINKIWTNGAKGPLARDRHTSTFLSDTADIIYIGGITGINDKLENGKLELIDMTDLDVYNTMSNTWSKWTTKNPPEPRAAHTSVLTNDKRIIVFGGVQVDLNLPVKNYYVVLDTNTLEWYHGNEDPSTNAPFIFHTATLYNDYMFISFGQIDLVDRPFSNDILIYKIGEYANFTEVKGFIYEDKVNPTNTAVPTITSTSSTRAKNGVIIGATLGGIFGVILLGFIGLFVFKWYKKFSQADTSKFSHALGA